MTQPQNLKHNSPQNTSVPSLTITKIPNLNTLVIRQVGRKFFVSTRDSIVIDVPGLVFILKFLITNDIVSYKVIEGLLEEFHSGKGG